MKIKTIALDIEDVRYIVDCIRNGNKINLDLISLFAVDLDALELIPREDNTEIIDFV